MPGESTYYKRIQVVLGLAGARKPVSIERFTDDIQNDSPPNFRYRRWNPKKNDYDSRCSPNAVKRTVWLACELKLIDSKTGALTSPGKEAGDEARYDRVLSRQIKTYLNENGCPLDRVEGTSQEFLRHTPPKLPTAVNLYVELIAKRKLPMHDNTFHTMLRLLANSGGLGSSRSQIFFKS
jgi:hypothetical protein